MIWVPRESDGYQEKATSHKQIWFWNFEQTKKSARKSNQRQQMTQLWLLGPSRRDVDPKKQGTTNKWVRFLHDFIHRQRSLGKLLINPWLLGYLRRLKL